ncbi:Fe-S protein assembly co-chaperone HscB [Paraliomyxa miuraensis]|uniref:Fe-S protein assembly co-chaperone HscB n=1 Tax=Paraliomyxa miuraensis TaxID=376150 RepID=UPI002259BB04|nr:Fe-S protein assembly co-chaperone HscB [Paraliomyxa miuraensis]MCX4242862.1 Fe-S protein assembly co-chaperone HscB [Paraliomyxa miuraensis]
MDHFGLLGLPRQYAIDRDALERAYLERAQAAHPDRFVGASSAEQRSAMERSASLNEGYRVLRDPVRRAEYLCRLAGIDVDSSEPEGGAPAMGQAFLMEMIERREAVEDARREGPSALDELRDGVEGELDDALDRAVSALQQGDSRRAAEALVERRYLQRLLDELDDEVER